LPDISLEKVLFSYPGGVDVYPEPGLTLALQSGVTALVGENGAGKTTLTKLLIGLLRPKSGDIKVAGLDVSKMTVAAMAKTVGYTFQNPDDQLFERTVKAEVTFGPRVLKKPAADVERGVAAAIKACGLEGREEVHPHDLGLSERKWVAMASALAGEPSVVVLDEPTLGQDYPSRQRLREMVTRLGAAGKAGEVRYAGPTSNAFADRALLKEAGIEPPHVTELAQALGLRECVNEAEFLATWRR